MSPPADDPPRIGFDTELHCPEILRGCPRHNVVHAHADGGARGVVVNFLCPNSANSGWHEPTDGHIPLNMHEEIVRARARKLVSYSKEGNCHYQFCLIRSLRTTLNSLTYDDFASPKYEYMTCRDLLVISCVVTSLRNMYTSNFGFKIFLGFVFIIY